MGTPDFAASCLRALVASGENIVGCVTGADRARGRGMKLTPTPVKSAALEAGIPVFQPATLRGEDFAELLISLSPDLIIVAAYGKLLPENVLWLRERARFASSEIPRSRADSACDPRGRARDRRYGDENGGGA